MNNSRISLWAILTALSAVTLVTLPTSLTTDITAEVQLGLLVLTVVAACAVMVEWIMSRGASSSSAVDASLAPVSTPLAPAQLNAEVVHFLNQLQAKGRFVDFVMGEISQFSDAQVGAAARVVHQGCRDLVRNCFDLAPLHQGQEGDSITVAAGANSSEYRLIGKVADGTEHKGVVVHRGWLARKITLPKIVISTDATPGGRIVAPVEVELR